MIQPKHAVIVEEDEQYQIMDICSGSTRLKLGGESSFEKLEPMKFYKLSNSDVIKFGGSAVAKFHVPPRNVIESSQATQSYNLNSSLSNRSGAKKHFFVAETESQSSCVEIPETQIDIPETQIGFKNFSNGMNSSDTFLDLKSDKDETSNDANMLSQNIFAHHSLGNKSSSSQTGWRFDDGLEEFELSLISKKVDDAVARDESPTLDIFEARDGSVTPDLVESDGDLIRPPVVKVEKISQSEAKQSEIETQINCELLSVKEELESQGQVRQCDIETQVMDYGSSSDDEDDDKTTTAPDFLALQTQPVISFDFRTRNQIRKQAEIKPKTVSLTDFDDTQQLIFPSKKSNKFAMETQPLVFNIPTNARLIKKTVNRILLSSDDSDEEQTPPTSSANKKLSQSSFDAMRGDQDNTSSGNKQLPMLKSPSYESEDEEMQTEVKAGTQMKQIEQNPTTVAQTTPARTSDSSMFSDTLTPERFPKLPSDSQIGNILDLINASQPSNESIVAFDTVDDAENEENVNQNQVRVQEKQAKKRVRRRIMKYDSESDNDEPGPSKKKSVRLASTKLQNVSAPKRVHAIAITNLKGSEKETYSNMIQKLGCKIVKRVSDADILLTSKKLKFTTKLLMAMCKGIPIVGVDFIDASTNNQRCVAPENFIISDDTTEKEKKFSLQNILREANAKKMFADHSVFVSTNASFPFEEVSELVEIAGGECLRLTDVPKHKKLVLIYNSADGSECKSMVEKYPSLIRLKDFLLVTSVLRQKI